MSVSRKISDAVVNKGIGSQMIRDGEIVESQSWEGSLEQMQGIFEQEKFNWQVIRARRNGPNWELTGERTIVADENAQHPRQDEETIEVIWREVMLGIRQAPGILTALATGTITAEKLTIYDKNAEQGIYDIDPFDDPGSLPIYTQYVELLKRKIFNFPSAVPVVRLTRSFQNKSRNRLGLGQAYVRSTPPIQVPGNWEWLKTTDERRRTGATYTQVEEWTGGTEQSTLIYPTSS